MATAACRARRSSYCLPRCPQCQEKPTMRNAISYIYLSLSPPASSFRLPSRPAEPPSPSGHTSLLLTPVTTCPSLAFRRSPPQPRQPGSTQTQRPTSCTPSHWYIRCAHMSLKLCTHTGTDHHICGPKPGALVVLLPSQSQLPARQPNQPALREPWAGSSGRGTHAAPSQRPVITWRQRRGVNMRA